MGKLKSVKKAAEKAVEALDMSHAARMQRARDMGFDTDRTFYHGTSADVRSVSAAFDPAKKDSANLLAGGAAAAVGIGAATQSDDSEAGVITKGGKKIIEAFHGSPHKFDKFSMDRIGTGEGAQAYGHGLYFADSKDVAKNYQPRSPDAEDMMMRRYKQAEAAEDYEAMEVWEAAMLHETPADIRTRYTTEDYSDEMVAKANSIADELGQMPTDGSLLKVHIDADPDTLLDWDKPLSEQPALNEALERAGYFQRYPNDRNSSEVSGGVAYSSLQDWLGRDGVDASAKLREAGIPGIRYLDGDSRSAGEGSYNYVMFDDKPISIQERGSASPEFLAATAAATAAFTQRREEKRGRYQAIRERLLNAVTQANRAATFALEAIEMPMRGYHGMTAAAGSLAAGNSLQDSLMRGGTVARQPIEQTAYELGGAMTDATGSPALGTAVNVGAQIMDPF